VDLSRPCQLCQSPKGLVISTSGRGGEAFRTVVCPACGLVFTDPVPEDVREFYEKSYRLEYKGVLVPKLKHVYRAGLVALDRHRRLGRHFQGGARLLDMGSGGGEFLYLMDRLGLPVKGVEPNTGYAGYSRQELGLDVTVGFIQDVELPPASLDVITVWHALEHTERPAEVLSRLKEALAEGGRLIVEVPNIMAACQSPAGTFHVAHLFTFGVETLSAMMVRAGLYPEEGFLSPDGGNLTVVARREAGFPPARLPPLPGPAQADEVLRIVLGRKPLAHLLSPWPIRRFLGRARRAVSERLGLGLLPDRPGTRRRLLDRLYGPAAGQDCPARPDCDHNP
jgi:2-polyprenyl-3-methyl-5-hydroxy-6-metoxy-1,4-benzoquinol methylase